MATVAMKTNDEVKIRELIDHWANAARTSDLDGIMCPYAPDIVAFDAIAQLQFKGKDAYRKHWEACQSMCSGSMIFEVHDLHVAAGDDGLRPLSQPVRRDRAGWRGKVGWMRATVCCRKIDGRWLVVHEHFSAPFDMETSKALFDLEP